MKKFFTHKCTISSHLYMFLWLKNGTIANYDEWKLLTQNNFHFKNIHSYLCLTKYQSRFSPRILHKNICTSVNYQSIKLYFENKKTHKFQLTENLPLSLAILFIIRLRLLQRFCLSTYKRKEKEKLFFT